MPDPEPIAATGEQALGWFKLLNVTGSHLNINSVSMPTRNVSKGLSRCRGPGIRNPSQVQTRADAASSVSRH
jgi:hypothetical protein